MGAPVVSAAQHLRSHADRALGPGSQAAERDLNARMAHVADTNAVLETRETEAKARVRAGTAFMW